MAVLVEMVFRERAVLSHFGRRRCRVRVSVIVSILASVSMGGPVVIVLFVLSRFGGAAVSALFGLGL